jgi:hypothetical protein
MKVKVKLNRRLLGRALEFKRVPSRRDVALMTVFFCLAVIAAGGLSFSDLISPYLPSYQETIPKLSANQTASLSYDAIGQPALIFQTPLDANVPVWGNITLCCVSVMPKDYPVLYVLTSTEYDVMQRTNYGVPWGQGVATEVSTRLNPFGNYSVNGQTGIETVIIRFTPQETGDYYFMVDPAEANYASFATSAVGTASGRLSLWHNENVTVRPLDPWVRGLGFAAAVIFMFVGAYFTVRSITKGEDWVKVHPKVLTSPKPDVP